MGWVSTRDAKVAAATRAVAVILAALALALLVASASLLVELVAPGAGVVEPVAPLASPGLFLTLVVLVGGYAGWRVLSTVRNTPTRTTRVDIVTGIAVFWIALHVSWIAFGGLLGSGSWQRYLTAAPTTTLVYANGAFYLALLVVAAFGAYRAGQGFFHASVDH